MRRLIASIMALYVLFALLAPLWAGEISASTPASMLPAELNRSREVVNLYGDLPREFYGASSAGPIYSIGCLSVGCPTIAGKPYDSQRAQQFIHTTTQFDATKQEYSSYLHMDAVTGKAPFWHPHMTYSAKAQVTSSANVYTTSAACLSGDGSGPMGAVPIKEGSCSWNFGGENTNGKTTLGVSIYSGAGSGNAWAGAFNAIRAAGGDLSRFTTGIEIDNTIEDSADHAIGGNSGDAYGLVQSGFATAHSIGTVAHLISTTNSSSFMWHCGVCVIGTYTAKDTGLGNSSNSLDGFLNNATANTLAGFHDDAGSRMVGFNATAKYSVSAFDATGARDLSGARPVSVAVRLLAPEKICFDVDDYCLSDVGGKLTFNAKGRDLFHVDAAANLSTAGVLRSNGKTPSTTSCGARPSIVGTSQAGVVTIGVGKVTACTIQLAAATPEPFAGCALTAANATAAGVGVGAYAALADRTTTRWIIRGTQLSGAAFNYVCM